MANFVKRRFASLVRCLSLEGSPGPFTLVDDIVPVVPVSSCLDQLAISVEATGSAAQGTGSSPGLEAGVYRLAWTISIATVLAAANVQSIFITTQGSVLLTIASVRTTAVGDLWLSGNCEINVPEGSVLLAVANGAGAGNVADVRVVAQAL